MRAKNAILLGVSLALALAGGLAFTQARKPINRKCPLKPDVRVDPALTVVHNGKLVGLCCSDCVDKWKKNPAGYFASVKADAHLPQEPEGYTGAKEALEAGQGGPYLVVLLFSDKSPRSAALLKAVSDPNAEAEVAKCAYARVEFKADSPEAKLLNVTEGGTLVFVDPVPTPAKVLKSLTTATPAQVIKEVTDGMKAIKK
jgi:hypothetical protein